MSNDEWRHEYVRLPLSENGKNEERRKGVQAALLGALIPTSEKLLGVLHRISPNYASQWNLSILKQCPYSLWFIFSDNVMTRAAMEVLGTMKTLKAPVPLLEATQGTVKLDYPSVRCLLANMILCTYPYRNENSKEYLEFAPGQPPPPLQRRDRHLLPLQYGRGGQEEAVPQVL